MARTRPENGSRGPENIRPPETPAGASGTGPGQGTGGHAPAPGPQPVTRRPKVHAS